MQEALQEVLCWDLAPESTAGAPAPPGAASAMDAQASLDGPEVELQLRECRMENAKLNFHEVCTWWPSAANGRLFPSWRPPVGCRIAVLEKDFQDHHRWTSPEVPAELGPSGFFLGQELL